MLGARVQVAPNVRVLRQVGLGRHIDVRGARVAAPILCSRVGKEHFGHRMRGITPVEQPAGYALDRVVCMRRK